MDVILPLPDGKAHIYYDEASRSYELIERAEGIELHHDHIVLDTNGMTKVTATDRERLLEIREELVDRNDTDRALIERTRAAVEQPLGPDETIIRLHTLLTDVELSMNRIASRAARLAEVERPFQARLARDVDATLRLIGGTPTGTVLTVLEREADRIRTERDRILNESYPYLSRIATPPIAARLLNLAGGMKRLASSAGSKVQLLGAEAALFRHLRNPRQRPPKHGVIHEHPLMQRVPKKHRGRFARILADRIVIAARVDYFGEADRKDIERTWNELESRATELA